MKSKERRIAAFPIAGRQSIVAVYRLNEVDFVARVLFPNGKPVKRGAFDKMIALTGVVHGRHVGLSTATKIGKDLATSLAKAQ